MGAYDPKLDETCLSGLDAHRVMHPEMVVSKFTNSRTRSYDVDQEAIHHGAVMTRESILERVAGHPWEDGAKGRGDGKSLGEGTASPNGL
jgi:hypothetical protein